MPETPPPTASSPTASNASTQETPSKPQQQPQEAKPAQSTIDGGNAPSVPPAAPRRIETYQHESSRVRGENGRFEPLIPRSPVKSDSVSFLKPLIPTTYDDSADSTPSQKGGIEGLSTIPKGWRDLVANVSLGVEIAWVQSNRLLVVKEKPGSPTKVDLSKARSPAPSWSALSWLETSIRSYAKFVEVASKQASSGQDEAEFVRRERMAVGEIRSILEEMKVAPGG